MRLVLGTLGLVISGVALSGAGSPAFTKKPTAARAGDKVKIEFAVSRPTDVADTTNRRVVKVKLSCAVEETCAVP